MSNSISQHKAFLAALDEVYKNDSLTAILDTEEIDSAKEAKTFTVDKLEMDGLSDYSRTNGYAAGDVTLTQEEVTPNYDRGTKFSVDEMDDLETGYVAFGKLSAEFERTKCIPELDAFRLATYAGQNGLGAYGNPATSADAVAAVELAEETLGNNEVPLENCVLFVSHKFYNLLKNGAATRFSDVNNGIYNRKLESFDDMKVVRVPEGRFFSAITLGQKGYTNAGVKLNFLIVEKSAVMQYVKHKASNIISPDANQDADAYILKYRNYGLADVYENKKVGIYAHGVRQAVKLTVTATPSGTTIVVKKTSSTGDTISAGADGKYTIPADVDKVYVSVSKTNYTTDAQVYDIDGVDNIAGAKTITVELEEA